MESDNVELIVGLITPTSLCIVTAAAGGIVIMAYILRKGKRSNISTHNNIIGSHTYNNSIL